MTTRRELLGAALALALARHLRAAPVAMPGPAPTLLVLGGTGFLGPHVVQAATRRGHEVTLFNRGKTNPGMFPQLEKLVGDRNGDLHVLEGRRWDAVIDTSGYLPSEVTRSAMLLAPNVGRYLFISTTAVYSKLDRPELDETAPLATLADASSEAVTEENYGALKGLCEQSAERAMPGRTIALRSGLIAGPGDPTDRFTYWPVRIKRGGEVLCPGAPEDPVQFIDVRDLADFAVLALERKLAGSYNVDSAPGALSMGKFVDTCRRLLNPRARLSWAPADFLAGHGLAAGTDLPVWAPAAGASAGYGRLSVAKASAAGLRYRPLELTIRDTLAWFESQPPERGAAMRAGLSPEREADALAALRAGARAK
jgi:2'-hydroxyisoflavone reductase